MAVIFHIAGRRAWDAARAVGEYTADSLASEGFIHCSTAEQVIATANRIFKGRQDLVLLCVDTDRVKPDIRYENLEGGTNLFPHIYGALAVDAVVAVHRFPPQADGSFRMPQGAMV
jgi:uncharacterized protein (DUF952 family)